MHFVLKMIKLEKTLRPASKSTFANTAFELTKVEAYCAKFVDSIYSVNLCKKFSSISSWTATMKDCPEKKEGNNSKQYSLETVIIESLDWVRQRLPTKKLAKNVLSMIWIIE